MLAGAKDNPCRKFQANIFNKSKCQNCFKPREVHLLTDEDLNQAKPIYGGWLCLAPEGTDFENPMQRSRKWQRRFFVLYEHGCLRYALDESPSTLPQGTVNMNQCTDVIDAEPKTGQKNALCIITPEREFFIRGESKEIINGWCEQLIVYPRTNKQNQKKKRKVEPTTAQEPGPAKVAVTGSGIPDAEKVPDSRSSLWQEELHGRDVEATQSWPLPDASSHGGLFSSREGEMRPPDVASDHSSVNGDEVDRGRLPSLDQQRQEMRVLSPTGSSSSRHVMEPGGVPRCPSPVYSDPFPSASSLLSNGSHISGSMSSLDSEASGSTVTSTDSHYAEGMAHRASTLADIPRARRISNRETYEAEVKKMEKRTRARSPGRDEGERNFGQERSRRSTVIEKLEALELENADRMETDQLAGEAVPSESRQGRSETRRFQRREEMRKEATRERDFHSSSIPPLRRAKSLDRRTTESIMTPDLLNFKKGWMVKLNGMGEWKKYWFVLTDHSLRYYKDSIAEDASDLDGEIDLSSCYNVTEYQVQRNYGFQIHTQETVYTLSAMTAGIRRNWIQAIMKNVRPSTAPDVASSLPEEQCAAMPPDTIGKHDSKSDSPSSETSSIDKETGQRRSRARDRRREGRSKTFDWAEFRPIAQALAQQRASKSDLCDSRVESLSPPPPELSDWERTKRREERRKRYEAVTGTPGSSSVDGGRMEFESASTSPPPDRQKKVHDEIEEHWQQVERTPLREERRIPLATVTPGSQTMQIDKLLETHAKELEDLKTQLENCQQELSGSQKFRAELEAQLKSAMEREQQVRAGYISQATCERGFAAMEDSHQKVIEELHRQHQRELVKMQEDKERLLAEETAATISAIEAMKNAHRVELERELEKVRKSQNSNLNADLDEICKQHEEELASLHREIEVLSEQYSQKCLENAHLAQALEAERQALRQCQRENQELNAHNQELNNRLATEITRLRTMVSSDGSGDGTGISQGKEVYELEVLLRVKESEIQYLKQEINSLKDELQTAQRDKKYATDKYKDIYTELSIVKAKSERDVNRLKEQLQLAHESLGEQPMDETEHSRYDIMKSKSNPDILKMAAAAKRAERTIRSKSVSKELAWES
ncbi:myosin phosphatase Rho-interacting protein isoform X4 [Callorhinchus milii]|uniref:myosin phosphatase Rho-interacting protein isoform X4 n=1 Tax=Callorhinchus milii TaxID=7868 RepID=UPI001C3FDA18|nr:myosin phosphatase Rho-interacting protein isoform X4 [Callorhinchus milii]